MENRKVKVKVTHLTKKFGDLLVLNDVSFDVYDGEFLCIVGRPGLRQNHVFEQPDAPV